MSFNHPDALALIQRFQEIDARKHFNEHSGDYGMDDTNVWGILDSSYQSLQRDAWQVMREEEESVECEVAIEEQSPRDYERMMTRLHELLDSYVDTNRDLTPYVRDNAAKRKEVRHEGSRQTNHWSAGVESAVECGL